MRAKIRAIVNQFVPADKREKFLPHFYRWLPPIFPSREKICHFLAQVLYETAGLEYLQEIGSGEQYEGRSDLGNTQVGDGRKFKGRGCLMITGRFNYSVVGAILGLPLTDEPDLLLIPENALLSALTFWQLHDLDYFAGKGDFDRICKVIQGDLSTRSQRWVWLNRVMTAWDRA